MHCNAFVSVRSFSFFLHAGGWLPPAGRGQQPSLSRPCTAQVGATASVVSYETSVVLI